MARQVPARNGGTLTRPEKGDPGGPGRPKKTVAATLSALKDQGYEEVTAEQVRSTMGRMLNLSRDQLVATGNDKTAPILDALIARALAGGKGWEALQDILDRAHGKAKQAMDVTTGGDKITLSINVPPLAP